MTWADLAALLPILAPAVAAVAVLAMVAIRPSGRGALAITIVGLIVGLVALPFTPTAPVLSMLVVDGHTLAFSGFVLVAALAIAPLGWAYLGGDDVEELLVLVLLAATGSCVLAAATHLATVILGYEILSLSLFGAIAYVPRRAPTEAAARYLVLAAGASATMIFGFALLYAETGALTLEALGAAFHGASVVTRAAMLLALVGLAFKLGLVPFHLWTLEVYQGAPAPVTALVATVSKAGIVAVLARWAIGSPLRDEGWFVAAIAILAGLSMLVGNLVALLQSDFKRLLAGSSVAHMGYALVAVAAGSSLGAATYVGTYVVTALVAFGVVSMLSRPEREATELSAYQGLLWRQPLAGAMLILSLLSLAGIPLTAGFVGKLAVLLAGVGGAWWALVVALVVGSAIGIFTYLRVVAILLAPTEGPVAVVPRVAWVPVVLATVLVLVVGVYPSALLALVPW